METPYSDRFRPDYTPDQLREMGVYDQLYAKTAPRQASMEAWPEHWMHPDDPKGWLEWYDKYNAGRRHPDDERQIKRWIAFKARHAAQYSKYPTQRREYALRNWGIAAAPPVQKSAAFYQIVSPLAFRSIVPLYNRRSI
jgi:hypothetical protein